MITTRQLSNRTEKISEITSTKDSHEAALEDVRTEPEKIPETFASLLRNSKFVQMGDPCGKVSFFLCTNVRIFDHFEFALYLLDFSISCRLLLEGYIMS